MDDEIPDESETGLTSRAPKEEDLVALCQQLNALGARYLVCGGFAIIQAGYPRATGDIALLVDASLENEALVFTALESLPDKAVRQLDTGDLAKYIVCRIADEVLVDLMASAGGIEYAEAAQEIVVRKIGGIAIPFASPLLLWRMKQRTHRAKDAPDLLFLRQLLEAQGITPPN
jgi:hypothetical protein